jgi:hypothetical protein
MLKSRECEGGERERRERERKSGRGTRLVGLVPPPRLNEYLSYTAESTKLYSPPRLDRPTLYETIRPFDSLSD